MLTRAAEYVRLGPAITAIARERPYFLDNPDKFVLVDTFADVERAKQENKLAIVFHFQGTNPVEGDVNMIETYHKLVYPTHVDGLQYEKSCWPRLYGAH